MLAWARMGGSLVIFRKQKESTREEVWETMGWTVVLRRHWVN